MTESRKGTRLKASSLPQDYLKMVAEVFAANFEKGLDAVAKQAGAPAHFHATGSVFPDEVAVSISLLIEGQMAATTVHASADFDPKASAPTLEDLLSACVDGIGELFGQLFESKQLEALTSQSLSSLENVPFQWTPVKVDKRTIHLLMDKVNPLLDQMASDWLEKNDPEHAQRLAEEAQETEKLFVTGKPKNPGTKH